MDTSLLSPRTFASVRVFFKTPAASTVQRTDVGRVTGWVVCMGVIGVALIYAAVFGAMYLPWLVTTRIASFPVLSVVLAGGLLSVLLWWRLVVPKLEEPVLYLAVLVIPMAYGLIGGSLAQAVVLAGREGGPAVPGEKKILWWGAGLTAAFALLLVGGRP